MWLLKRCAFVFVLLQLTSLLAEATKVVKPQVLLPPKPRPCNIAYKCSNQGTEVVATDGKCCFRYINACHLASANCARQNEYKKVLRVASESECKILPIKGCIKTYKPVCAQYKGGAKETFGNQCMLDSHICHTGKQYVVVHQGACNKPSCDIRYKCSTTEEKVVFYTDGKTCFVFLNDCHAKNANCNRQNNNQKLLKRVSRKECQKLCHKICTLEYRPVCAMYRGKEKTFGNACALANHICSSGKPYAVKHQGECKKPCIQKFHCNKDIEVVYASDGKKCLIYQNDCYYRAANCRLQNEHKKVHKSISKKHCQKLCPKVCSNVQKPVCASYKGVQYTFTNKAHMVRKMCTTGKYYILEHQGKCKPCVKTFKCSKEVKEVYAIDGKRCIVYQSICHLNQHNCERQNRHQKVLKTITKKNCQKMCPKTCSNVKKPVCASQKGVHRTFSNLEVMYMQGCREGKHYVLVHQGACKKRCTVSKCSNKEGIVFASDGKQCHVFANKCHFSNANCQRKNSKQKLLKLTSKAECKRICSKPCSNMKKPVCAALKGVQRTFPNREHVERERCMTGKLHIIVHQGSCKPKTNAPYKKTKKY